MSNAALARILAAWESLRCLEFDTISCSGGMYADGRPRPVGEGEAAVVLRNFYRRRRFTTDYGKEHGVKEDEMKSARLALRRPALDRVALMKLIGKADVIDGAWLVWCGEQIRR